MREICVRLQEAGHDIQLHLHPVWGFIGREDWKRRLAIETPNDDMDGRSVNQLVDWMQYGQETFKRWKLPDPVAFWSGSNRVDRNLYRAMSAVGLRLASNIARGIFEPRDHALRLSGGAHQIENVVEMPVTSYFSRFGWPLSRCRALTITGTSLMELIQILEQAHAQRAQVVTLLTHCHEFVRGDPSNALEVNRINQERWTALCRFLHDCADRFEVVSISEFGQSAVLEPSDQHQEIRLPFGMGVKRMVQNKLNEYGLA